MFRFAEQPLSVSKLYRQGLALYKETFSNIWYLFLINMLIMAGIEKVLRYFLPAGVTISKLSANNVIIVISATIIAFVIATYFFSLIMHRMYSMVRTVTAPDTLRESCTIVWHKLSNLAVTKFTVVSLSFLGVLLFVVPGICAFVFFLFFMPAILFDNKGIFGALKLSCKLVWGNWWRTFSVMLLPGAAYALGMIVRYFGNSAAGVSVATIMMEILFIVFATALFPIIISFILVQYNDLKLRMALKSVV